MKKGKFRYYFIIKNAIKYGDYIHKDKAQKILK